jgi:hypothetical protein
MEIWNAILNLKSPTKLLHLEIKHNVFQQRLNYYKLTIYSTMNHLILIHKWKTRLAFLIKSSVLVIAAGILDVRQSLLEKSLEQFHTLTSNQIN